MGRKGKPPREPKPAIITRDQGAGMHVHCWNCGQRLPDVSVHPADGFIRLSVGPDDADEWGWALDGTTLRPTKGHLARRQRAREIVRLGGSREVKTRHKLAGKASLLPISHVSVLPVIANYLGRVIEQVECPRCRAENLIESHSAVR